MQNKFENLQDGLHIKLMDYAEYEEEIDFHKAIAENNESGGYQILVYELLPYTVPIAMQSAIVMTNDMLGNPINDIYNCDPNERMQNIHICVFPLEEKSVVLAFYHKRDKLYRNLRHQINSSSKEKILKYVNYLIFAYTENYFISKIIQGEIETNENLAKLSQEYDGSPNLGFLGADNKFGIGYNPISADDIPNFLSHEWAI